jgi:hypothetical protein
MTVNYLDYNTINALKFDQVFETAVQAALVLASIQQRSIADGGEVDFQGDAEKEAKYNALCDNILNDLEKYTAKFKTILCCWPDYLNAIEFSQDAQTLEWSSPDFNAGGSLMFTIKTVLWEKIK